MIMMRGRSAVRGLVAGFTLLLAASWSGFASPATPRENWRAMKYGFFVHYVWDGRGTVTLNPDGSHPASIDDLCNRFDAKSFADDIASMGVEYLVFTAWHANLYPLFPSAAIERIQPGRSPKRDLLGDMIDAVKAKGIRVFFYTHPEQPVFGLDHAKWNDFLSDLYGEVAARYGSRLDGLYLDENSITGDMNLREDFPRLERTIRARAPHLMLMQNFYGNMYCADVGVGEYTSFAPADPLTWGSSSYQGIAHVMSKTWSAQVPRGQNATPFSPEGLFRFTVLQAGTCLDGGGVFWAAGPYPGGGWETGVLPTMQKVGAYIAPVARSIKSTYASTSYPTRTGTSMAALEWGVATRSTDDLLEYLHVLKPPAGKELNLPLPADGKVFGSARLLPSEQPVTFSQDATGVHLTLPNSNTWSPLDTVVELKTISQGGPGLVNDTSPAVRYSGRGWAYGQGRQRGEYQDDVHATAAAGDAFTLSFDGTAVALIVSPSADGGRLALTVDGVAHKTISLPRQGGTRQTVYARSGLPDGQHSLRGVLKDGRLVLDAFRITEEISNTESGALTYGKLLVLNDTDPTIAYTGGTWGYQTGRDMGELNADIHYARDNGDYFTVGFIGTGIEFLSNAGGGRGLVDFYVDDQFYSTVDMSQGSWARNRKLAVVGLPLGPHRLKGVKKSGTYLEVDMFRVYAPGKGAWRAATTTAPGGASGEGVHTTTANDDYFQLSFSGTGVDFISDLSRVGGTVDCFLDGVLIRRANHYNAEPRVQATTFSAIGLAREKHTLVGVKKSGTVLDVGAFGVYK